MTPDTMTPPDGVDPVAWGAARWWSLHQPDGETPENVWVAWDALASTGKTPDGARPWTPPIKGGAQVGKDLRFVRRIVGVDHAESRGPLRADPGEDGMPLYVRASSLDARLVVSWTRIKVSVCLTDLAVTLLPPQDVARAVFACARAAVDAVSGANARRAAEQLAVGEAWSRGEADDAALRGAMEAAAVIAMEAGLAASASIAWATTSVSQALLHALLPRMGHAGSAATHASFVLSEGRVDGAAAPILRAHLPTPSVLAWLARRSIEARRRKALQPNVTRGRDAT